MTIEEQITRLLLYASSDVNKLYDKLIKELSKVTAASTTRITPDELYTIAKACTPSEKERVQALLDKYIKALQAVIQQGITLAVLHSANIQQKALAAYTRWEGKEVERWRKDTVNAFIRSRMKRDGGLNLSDRVWNYTQQTKSEFELAVSQVLEQGIGKGISAETLGRQVRQFLNNPDMMYRRYHMKKLMSDGTKKNVVEWRRRVVDEQGKVHFVKEDLAKVGTGVYRSSRQNALRLTITETNMAYNFANCERWSSEPYVLGIRIRLSGNHPEEDICDELAGDYPKDFMWRGWHPRCRCSMSSILMDRNSEEWKHLRSLPENEYKAYQSPNAVKNVPEKFNKWCERNAKKLDLARERGKLPYFVRDNQKVVGDVLGWEDKQNESIHALSETTKREKAINKAIKSLNRQRNEQMQIIGNKGQVLFSTTGTPNNVYFDESVAKLLKGNTLVHNHPDGFNYLKNDFRRTGHSLSSDDLYEAVRCDMKEIVASSPLYRYSARKSEKLGWGINADNVIKEYRLLYDDIELYYREQLTSERQYILQHLTMKELSKRFGFIYSKSRL